MSKFFTLLTTVGEAKLANATALGQTVKFEKMAIGDGNGELPVPDQKQTALVNEVRRELLNSVETDPDNPNWIVCEQVIPENVGGWTIREVGIYDVDGDLIAVGNFPETYKPILEEGSGRTQTVRLVLQVSATATVELKIDPSVVLATRKYVNEQDAAHQAESNPHPQYTELSALVGVIAPFHTHLALPGWHDLKGGTLSRVTDKQLFDYALTSGLWISQAMKDSDPITYAMYFGDGNGVSTFTLPNHHFGHFIRGNPDGVVHGETQGDTIRNITGSLTGFGSASGMVEPLDPQGAFSRFNSGSNAVLSSSSGLSNNYGFSFDASKVVPTADENRPLTANLSMKIFRGWI
ncbi:phage tail protein [Vibrio fluvialis]|nr:phage tail protein [Vibrio fluvialis]